MRLSIVVVAAFALLGLSAPAGAGVPTSSAPHEEPAASSPKAPSKLLNHLCGGIGFGAEADWDSNIGEDARAVLGLEVGWKLTRHISARLATRRPTQGKSEPRAEALLWLNF